MTKQITLATLADLDELVHLLNVLFTRDIEFEPDYIKQRIGLELIILNPEIGEILVMKIDGKVLGMVSLLYSISTALGGKVATLEDMVIAEEFRRKGLGAELLKEAVSFARKRGCLRLTLLTDFNNDTAIKFYERAGFNLSKMIPLRLVF
ncbi:MAG TPA: GNAT family N-acetyltransferase [Prolixibacteraceae bacterium]|nr:GNAT family N-acetyltransferase [Prolixibacteraceae bacterium]HPR85743.1 GNAT family N-acetyltransferase [Prolixibacteraceae bacterium]